MNAEVPRHYGVQFISIAVDRDIALLLHGEAASDDGPSSQSNQRGFRFVTESGGNKAIRSLWPDQLISTVLACDARALFWSAP